MPADQLKALLVLTAGRPLYRPQLAADRDAIERAYRNLGYQSVAVNSQLAFENEQRFVKITWTIREGEQITVDRILINGHARVSVDLIRREVTLQSGSPMSDDAIIESQRRLAATGLFRRVRITELPRTGAVHPRRADRDRRGGRHDGDRRRRPRGRPAAAAGRRRRPGRGAARRGAARVLRHQPPQPVGQEPIGHAVRARHAAAARPGDRQHRPDRHRRLRLQRLSRLLLVPRAARLRHDRRRAVHGLHRAGPAVELQFQSPRRERRLRAPHRRPSPRPAATRSTTPGCSTSRSSRRISC